MILFPLFTFPFDYYLLLRGHRTFKDLLERIAWDQAVEERGAQESLLIFKDHLLQRQKCQEACMDEQGAPGQTQTQKESLQKVEARTGNLGGIQKYYQNTQGAS